MLWREPGGKARPRDASQKARQTGQAWLIRLDSLPVRTMVAAGLLLPVARGERGHEVVQPVAMAQPARMLARVRGRVGTLQQPPHQRPIRQIPPERGALHVRMDGVCSSSRACSPARAWPGESCTSRPPSRCTWLPPAARQHASTRRVIIIGPPAALATPRPTLASGATPCFLKKFLALRLPPSFMVCSCTGVHSSRSTDLHAQQQHSSGLVSAARVYWLPYRTNVMCTPSARCVAEQL